MKKLNCLFLRNITLEPIEEMLVSNAKKYDMNIKTIFSDYDNILQSSLDLDFLKNKKIDVINVFLWLPNFSDTLSNRITSSSQKKINNEINRLNDFIQIVSKNLSRLEIPVIWTSMNLSYESTYGLFDYKFENSHENILGKINTSLKKIISVYKNFYYYDLTKSERSIGSKFLFDQRFWYTAKSPFSHDGFNQISKDLSEMLFSIFNKRSKCLVLDCDNVLWGGIVGENGVNGIKISNNGDSEFTDFQKEVINLQKSGIILAICSKNNIQDVFEVFEKRKDMILKKNDFTVIKANWKNKADNILEISKELNIGLDSIVFVDDSKFEIGLIKKFLPEVKTIHLPIETSEQNKSVLINSCYFKTINLTKEDKQRSSMYKAELKRKNLKNKTISLDTYLKSLGLEIIVRNPKLKDLNRVEQMTQRTNQFNLTTKRLNLNDIQKLSKNKNDYIYILDAKDKFGDYGTCGLSIVNVQNKNAYLEVFLMSCRIIGRGIENTFLSEVMSSVMKNEKKLKSFIGKYIPTKKNAQVKDFYINNNFSKNTKKGKILEYVIDSKRILKLKKNSHIKVERKFH